MDTLYYPPVSFYFKVECQGLPGGSSDTDCSFQEVGGLTATVETTEITEGGQNGFKHRLPTRTTYDKLTLKRGLIVSSPFLKWCSESISRFEFKPITLYIHLLDENGITRMTWEIVNAYPIKWSISNFNAEQNAVAIESVELNYLYFNIKTI
jgi:phage tail-like protein